MKARILIAEDDPNIRLGLVATLESDGYAVTAAGDGAQALKLYPQQKFDLVLLDIMMPKLSGFEVCQEIRSNPETKGIMVLMVTALNELGDIERAVDAGTDDFLSKPVNKLELVKRVENMLKFRHVADENERLRRYIEEMERGS